MKNTVKVLNPVLFVLLSLFFYFFSINALLDAYKQNNNSKIITGALMLFIGTIYILLKIFRYKKEIRKEKIDET